MNVWTKQIDSITEEFVSTFGGLITEQLNRSPDSATWSIAQNIQHVILVNESYFPVLDSTEKGTYKHPASQGSDSLFLFSATEFLPRSGLTEKRK